MEQGRLKRLRQLMAEHKLEALLITNPYNRRYVSGFTGTAGYVVITAAKAILFTDFRYMSQAPKQAVHYEVIEHEARPMVSVKETLQQLHIKELGFEQADISYSTYHEYAAQLEGVTLKPAPPLIELLRMQKDEAELQIMKEAAQLADQTFAHLLSFLKPGIREREVALEIEFYLRRHGATSTSFDTIVASGERSALPHGVASDRLLQNNEFVKLDFGAYYKGYCSDITRTVVLGKASDKHKEIYNIVLEAQMHALQHIKPGMTGREADALARDVIAKYGYAQFFGHGTGHGLGMQIHEAPRLSMQSDAVLQSGNTVTVEPGIYLPDFGGVRIEDDIVITDSGNRLLTFSTKQLLCID